LDAAVVTADADVAAKQLIVDPLAAALKTAEDAVAADAALVAYNANVADLAAAN